MEAVVAHPGAQTHLLTEVDTAPMRTGRRHKILSRYRFTHPFAVKLTKLPSPVMMWSSTTPISSRFSACGISSRLLGWEPDRPTMVGTRPWPPPTLTAGEDHGMDNLKDRIYAPPSLSGFAVQKWGRRNIPCVGHGRHNGNDCTTMTDSLTLPFSISGSVEGG
jgi:hypothetical protein